MGLLRKVGIGIGAVLGLLVLCAGGMVAYGATTYEEKLTFADAPSPKITASADPAVIERGRYLATGPAHCSQCHSTTNRAHPEKVTPDHPLTGGLEFAMGPIGTTYSSNLTPDPETGIGKLSDGQLARAIRTGVTHDGKLSILMRFAAANLSDEDLGAVISFLRSRPPVKNAVQRGQWGLLGKTLVPVMGLHPDPAPAPRHVPESAEPSVARGEYLADHVALCTTCHTQADPTTFEPAGPKAAGSLPDPSHGEDSDKEYVAPNLTSDKETGFTGRLDEDAFIARLRGGRVYASSIMPWEGFRQLTESDARSIYRYLRSLPPVKNDVGPSYRDKGWKAD